MTKRTLQLQKLGISSFFALIFLFAASFACAAPGDVWQVSVPVGNARALPQTSADLVNQLPKGTSVTELAREGVWLKVQLADGSEAWMHQVTLSQSVELFDLSLNTADRTAMRKAIRTSKVKVVREVDTYPYDLYDPSQWKVGATEMTLGYTLKEQLFAVAEITYRSEKDTEQVRQVAEAVRKELGPWQRVLGRRAKGPVEFEWRRGDLRVLVHRGWPDTTTYVVYEVTDRLNEMQADLEPR
ncbi:SH3 domain-containing protein [Marinospirillum insulare]|nr:SH3 domain-containing protein [Marinospirillum insulare]